MTIESGGDQFQNGTYIGINLENILYGVELVLYFMTMYRLLGHEGRGKRSNVFYAVFSSVMLLSVTIWISTQASFGQHMWLLNADFPGGPNAYWDAHISDWNMELGTTAMIILQLMTDALMVTRCWIVWNSYSVIIVPSILWIGTLALGTTVIWMNSTGGIYFRSVASQIFLAYFSVATFLSAILTLMICYRMLWMGKRVEAHLGREYASPYFIIFSLMVESMVPYVVSGIALLVVLGIEAQIVNGIAYTHVLIMCISPQMLILRVAMGTTWTHETCQQPHSTIKFSPRSMTETGTEVTEVLTAGESRSSREVTDLV